MDEKARRRAGLDYWEHVDVREHADWHAYIESAAPERLRLFTTRSSRAHWRADYQRGDHLVFGSETAGVPGWLHEDIAQRWGADARVNLPMAPGATRSLNLANAATAACYEALRQQASGAELDWTAEN
jgi:tRNA (cytidine/uridine-2'-O-)-methyltransferase